MWVIAMTTTLICPNEECEFQTEENAADDDLGVGRCYDCSDGYSVFACPNGHCMECGCKVKPADPIPWKKGSREL